MKKIIGILICILYMTLVYGQAGSMHSVHGTVKDSVSNTVIQYSSVTLIAVSSQKAVTGAITDSTGRFFINDAPEGTYNLLVEFIGYKPFTIKNIVLAPGNKSLDLGVIKLYYTDRMMDNVTVTSRAKTIDNKIDRMVFNAEKDVSSQTGNASDLLKKVPQVSVDADGNVQLAGSSGIRFLINGKPSTAFGSSVADVLQSIPAAQIKSIEVITNPGAKYDAQGLGGIINIILKSSNAKGYNGNLSLSPGIRQENGSFNFNVRNNNVGFNAFISGNKRLKSTVPFSTSRTTADGNNIDYLQQDGSSQYERHGVQTGFGFDWTLKKYNSFSGSLSYNVFGNGGVGFTNQDLQINKGSTTPAVLSQINSVSKSTSQNTDVSLNYKRTFIKEGRELEFALTNSKGISKTRASNDQILLPQQAVSLGTQSVNPAHTTETQVSIDYTEPLATNIILGAGGRVTVDNIKSSSTADSYDAVAQRYYTDNSLTSNLNYKQNIYAGYAEITVPIFAGITAKAGGRYERTETNAFFSNAQQQQQAPGYNIFVPSIYLSKKIGETQTVKLSYSKRIERPDYNALNPFVNTADPKNLSTGNPNLRTEIGHRIEMSYNKDFGKTGSVMVNVFYRINKNDIQPYAVYYPLYIVGDSTYTNVSVTTSQNIGSEQNMGANIFGDLHVNSKLGLRGNVFMFRRHTINMIDKGYNTNSFNYRFNINANYQFKPTLVAELFGNFNSPRHEAQGRYPAYTSYTFAIRKQFWNKKGSLALTASNFFSKYVDLKTELFGPGYESENLRRIPFRSVGLNFSWKFGKLEFKKAKEETPGNE